MQTLASLALAAVFLVAAGEKLRSPRPLRAAVTVLVAPSMRAAAFRLVLAWELALGVWLASGFAARAAAWSALATLAALTGAGALLHVRGAACGCFGTSVSTLRAAAARNVLLATAAVALALAAAPPAPSAPAATARIAAALAGALAVLLLMSWWRTSVESARERPAGDGGGLLAGPQTRRGFLARSALTASALGAASAARASDGAPLAVAPTGCMYGRGGVNVCYSPYRVVRSEPAHRLPAGYRGVALRKGPSPDAPIVYKYGEPVIIPVGRFLGRQSLRDGGVPRHCPDPGLRPTVAGFMVGYPAPPTHDKTGWMALGYGGDTFAQADPTCPLILCGPAKLDFDCRGGTDDHSPYRSTCGHRKHGGGNERGGYECGGDPEDPGTCFPPRATAVVESRQKVKSYGLADDLSREFYNLKYTEDGTTTHWLVPGDRVREYCIKCVRENPNPTCPPDTYDRHARGCCQSYSCIEVIDARWVPRGVRGWVGSAVLADGGVPPTLRHSLDRVMRDVLFLGKG